MKRAKWLAVVAATAAVAFSAGRPVSAEDEPAGASETVILGDGSSWRTHVTWRTPVLIGKDGALKPLLRRKGRAKDAPMVPVPVWTSQAPPADWMQPAFDDSRWARARSPHGVRLWHGRYTAGVYEAGNPAEVQAIRVRGRFRVDDPTAVGALRLALRYHGGVVVYVNGTEVARFHLPAGPIGPDTVAERYPDETYFRPDGKALNDMFDGKACKDRIAARTRAANDVLVPANLLKKGVNVLAVEVRRAPLYEERLTRKFAKVDWHGPPTPWRHASLESLTLTAPAGAAVVPSTAQPTGFQVWNCRPHETVTLGDCGNPCEPLRPVRIVGARNGHFSGRLVVSSTDPIKGLGVTVSDLVAVKGAGAIPADSVRVRYAVLSDRKQSWNSPERFEALVDTPPAEVPVIKVQTRRGRQRVTVEGVVAPVWITVDVPADASPGDYEATVTVRADGAPPVEVPLRLTVNDWRVPDPKDFVTTNNLLQSPDTLARTYGVSPWSDRHVALMGRTLALLAEVGGRFCHLDLSIGYDFTNSSRSLVRWVKPANPGDPYTYDFALLDRYLDLFEKTVGTPRLVRLNVWGQSSRSKAPPLKVTVLDPATGKQEAMQQPAYGTPESLAFWKPVLAAVRKRLEKRGWFANTAVGYTSYCWAPSPTAVSVYKQIWPDGRWINTSHSNPSSYKSADGTSMPVPYCEHIWGAGRLYDPDVSGPGRYPVPWKRAAKRMEWGIPRYGVGIIYALRDTSRLVAYRAVPEAALQGTLCGIGHAGADFWPLVNEKGRLYDLCQGSGGVGPGTNVRALLTPGPDGPAPNERFEMFREGVQIREAMVVVQKALDANALPAEVAAKASALLDERARYYIRTRRGQLYHWLAFEGSNWQARDDALFAIAGVAARALKGT